MTYRVDTQSMADALTSAMDRDLGITLGRRLKELRQAAGLTQADLGARTLKTWETISNIERGKRIPSLMTLTEFADKLGVDLVQLLQKPGDETQQSEADRLLPKLRRLSARDLKVIARTVDQMLEAEAPTTQPQGKVR